MYKGVSFKGPGPVIECLAKTMKDCKATFNANGKFVNVLKF